MDHAPDGQEGLHLAVTEPYDAAIIDVMLPKLDGLSVIERMQKIESAKDQETILFLMQRGENTLFAALTPAKG